jgi:hypothetical protein
MKNLVIAIATLASIQLAFAENSCEMKAAEKKIYGAAKNSFVKKCEKDARAVCEKDDISKKTSGAAKEAHIKKCVNDALAAQ